jgi:hypothetical protein
MESILILVFEIQQEVIVYRSPFCDRQDFEYLCSHKKMDLLCILEFFGETKSTSWNAECGLMLLCCAGRKVLIWAWIIWLLWTFFVSGVGPCKISELLLRLVAIWCSRKKRTQMEDFGFAHQVLANTTSYLGYPVLHAFCSCLAKCSKENK